LISYKAIRADVSQEMSYVYEKVKQYDNLSRKYRIIITDKGNMVSLNGNEAIRIRMWADGESIPYVDKWLDDPWENGYPILIMTSGMLSKVGKVKYEFVIQEPGSPALISTRQQNLLIQKSLINYDGLIASEDFDVLSHLIGQATTIPDLINDINVSLDDVSNKISEVNSTMAEYERQMQIYATEYGEMKTDMQDIIDALHVYMENVENSAASSAKLSESWAIGGTNSRDGEATNNSKFHSDQSKLYSDMAKESADRAEEFAGHVDPKTLSQINAVDESGLLGTIGAIVTGQELTNEMSSRISTELLRKSEFNTAMTGVNSQLAENFAQIGDLGASKADKIEVNLLATDKADKAYVDLNVSALDVKINSQASGSPKGVYNTVTDLQIAFPTGNSNIYVVTADGKWYYWNGSAWTVGGAYQSTGIGKKTITFLNTDFIDVGKNIFNKNTVTNDYYVQYNTGVLVKNTLYAASNYIPVEPILDYYMNYADQVAFYDANKNYISGKGMDGNTFSTPSNCAYIRVSLNKNYLNYLQVEKGSAPTDYEEWGYGINYLKPMGETLDRIKNIESLSSKLPYKSVLKIIDDLKNPFIKTKIKIIGDSITAGVGGTGYSPTGESIGTTEYRANITTATCWANSLKKNLESNYNKYRYVSLLDERIRKYSSNAYPITLTYNGNTKLGTNLAFINLSKVNFIKFNFYGDKFTIVHSKLSGGGIIDVYVDKIKVGSIDSYSPVFEWSQETEFITSLGNHTVVLQETNTKNDDSVGLSVFLEAIKIPKVVTVKNWGISGIGTHEILNMKDSLIETDDDIVIMQIGTNDRVKRTVAESTKDLQRQVINYVEGLGKKIIQMVAPPSSLTSEDLSSRNFHMWDVDRVIGELSAELNREYISNYQYFKKYCAEQNINIDTLLSDGLHPNDRGYELIYSYICSRLELPSE